MNLASLQCAISIFPTECQAHPLAFHRFASHSHSSTKFCIPLLHRCILPLSSPPTLTQNSWQSFTHQPTQTPVFLFTPRCVSVSEMLRNLIHICSSISIILPSLLPRISSSISQRPTCRYDAHFCPKDTGKYDPAHLAGRPCLMLSEDKMVHLPPGRLPSNNPSELSHKEGLRRALK